MSEIDPFNESVEELRQLIVKAKLLEQETNSSGVVTSEKMSALTDVRTAAEEMLEMLKEMLRVLEQRGGKVHGRTFSANEVLDRQNTLRSLEAEVQNMIQFSNKLSSKHMSGVRAAFPTANESSATGPDEYIMSQQLAQEQESQMQDEVIDRLTYGLQELRETGGAINEELATQEVILTDVERDISGVQVRLRAANEKVDKLLASMSNKGKVCTIVVLIFILVFLAFFAF